MNLFSVVEMFIKLTPQFINNKKDDGYTMLHLAALNGNIYVVNALAASVSCVNMHAIIHIANTSLLYTMD